MPEHYIAYIDDSGDQTTGVLFSAILVPAAGWSEVLGHWIGLRREFRDAPYGLPTFFELHAQPFTGPRPTKPERKAWERREKILAEQHSDLALRTVQTARAQIELSDVALTAALHAARAAGRSIQDIAAAARLAQQDVSDRLDGAGDPSALSQVPCLQETPGARTTRVEMYEKCLLQIVNLETVHLMTAATDLATGDAKTQLYGTLLSAIDGWLAAQNAWGTVVVDGTPSARTLYYREAHRSLNIETRRILEDEVLRDSSESHFIQMADLVAFSAHELRSGKSQRYLELAERIITPDGQPPTAVAPGFFS